MTAEQQTPQQRAERALKSSQAMCELLAQCRQYRVAGWWDGSAFRSHPVGLISGAIKLTNHWHVDNLCTIEITDGAGWDRAVCQDSRAYGNPHPKPINGKAVQAWRCGSFESPEIAEALTSRLLELLTAAAECIQRASDAERVAAEAAAAESRRRREDTLAAALANAVTGA